MPNDGNFTLDQILGIVSDEDDKSEVITVDDKYYLVIEKADEYAFIFPYTKGNKGVAFTHPNIAGSRDNTLEFKHYHSDGGKHWTSESGVEHAVLVERSKIEFLKEKGYSYPKVRINGVTLTLNTSGGSYKDGWGDYIPKIISTCVNVPVTEFKAICDVAIRTRITSPQRIEEREI